jgi:2-C-methyl-D-erythritol 2,4-cyclodiphosphate synthase
MILMGIGQDSHVFVKEKNIKKLVLGGVELDFEYGFKANSDGDVILHALCNALSSAIGGDSISTWADEMCRNNIFNSQEYVKVIFQKIKEKNIKVTNVSISVEAKNPFVKLGKSCAMKQIIAKILEIPKERIGLTFTSGENLTPFGKGEGVQVFCLVNLFQNDN